MQRHAVNVPTDFYARFTRDIVALAQEQGTSVDGRVVSVLEGGYSDKALISGVLSHVSGLCHGHNMSSSAKQETDLVSQMANMTMGLSGLPINGSSRDSTSPLRYNSEWWLSENLDALVQLLNPEAGKFDISKRGMFEYVQLPSASAILIQVCKVSGNFLFEIARNLSISISL